MDLGTDLFRSYFLRHGRFNMFQFQMEKCFYRLLIYGSELGSGLIWVGEAPSCMNADPLI